MLPIDKLIADFDGTVSEVDTLGQLVQTATKHRTVAGDAGARNSFLEWRETVERYSKQQARIVDEWLNSDSRKTTDNRDVPAVGPNLEGLRRFLDASEVLEYTSTHRVMEKKFLAGLTRQTLRDVGRSVQIRPGVFHVIEEMRRIGVKIEILSANWSKTFIEGAMNGMCDQITTNSLVFDKSGRSTGEINLQVISAQDKLKHFLRLKSESYPATTAPDAMEHHNAARTRTGRTLYIGDSVTDLLAILEADIGVFIGTKQTAIQAMKRFGIPSRKITDGASFDICGEDKCTVLHVDSWETLGVFLRNAETYVK